MPTVPKTGAERLAALNRSKRQQMSVAAFDAVDRDPEQATREANVAEQLGVGVDLVRGQLREAEAQANYTKILGEARKLSEDSEDLGRWLATPGNLDRSWDDLDTFGEMLNYAGRYTVSAFDTAQTSIDLGREMSRDIYAFYGLGDAATDEDIARRELLRSRQRQALPPPEGPLGRVLRAPGDAAQLLPFFGTGLFHQAEGFVKAGAPAAALSGAAGSTFFGVGAVPAAAVGGLTVGRIGANVNAAKNMFEIEGGLMLDELLTEEFGGQKISRDTAIKVATAVGALNAGIELMQLNMMRRVYGDAAGTVLRRQVVQALKKKTVRDALTQALKQGAGQGAQESIQETVQVVGAIMAQEIDFAEFTGQDAADQLTVALGVGADDTPGLGRIWEAGAAAMTGSALLALPGSSTNVVAERLRAARVGEEQAALLRYGQVVKESKLAQRDRRAFAQAASATLASEGPVYVDARALFDAARQDPTVIEDVMQQTPGLDAQSVAQAAGAGQDLEIPFSVYTEHIAGTGFDEKLATVFRREPGVPQVTEDAELTGRDQEQDYAEDLVEREEQRRIQEQRIEERDLIEDEITRQLEAVPQFDQTQARNMARLHSEFFLAQSVRRSTSDETFTPLDLFNVDRVVFESQADSDGITYNQLGRLQQDDAFREWFGASRVVADDGRPAMVFHGSRDSIGEFRTLSHFGTSLAASDVMDVNVLEEDPPLQGERLYPVHLRIENPLQIKDTGLLQPADYLSALQRTGRFDDDALMQLEAKIRGVDFEVDTEEELIAEFLADHGFDGLVYENRVEDPGSTSYVIVDPRQVKSVFNTAPTEAPGILDQPTLAERSRRTFYQDAARRQEIENPFPEPDGVEDRLRRKTERTRDRGQGQPRNEARVVTMPDGSLLPIGRMSPQQWVDKINSILSLDQIDEYRQWYYQVHDVFADVFGESAPEFAAAWLIAQQNASPVHGLLSALRVREQAITGARGKKGGLAHNRLTRFWSSVLEGGQAIEATAGGQKLYDFVDSAAGRTTRRWMGDDPRGGEPAVIDVHTSRDIGFVDESMVNALRGLGVAEDQLPDVDMVGGPTEAQYEFGQEFLTEVRDYVNAEKPWPFRVDRVSEVQALGWMATLTQLGKPTQTARDAIRMNSRVASSALLFGDGAPYNETFSQLADLPYEAQQELTAGATSVATQLASDAVGRPPIRSQSTSSGAWQQFPAEPSTQTVLLSSPEVAADFADALGYLLQQSAVRVERVLAMTEGGQIPQGANSWAIDIVDNTGQLAHSGTQMDLWSKLGEALPDFMQLEVGYHPIVDANSGYPGMRIGVPRTDFPGPTGLGRLESDVLTALQQVIDEQTDLEVAIAINPAEAELRSNNWEVNSDGQEYLSRIEARYGPDGVSRLRRGRSAVDEFLRVGLERDAERRVGRDRVDLTEVEGRQPERLLDAGQSDGSAGARSTDPQPNLRSLGLLDENGSLALLGDSGRPAVQLSDLHHGPRNSLQAQRALYRSLGLRVEPDQNTSDQLKIYPLADAFGETDEVVEQRLRSWLDSIGWDYRIFGPKAGPGGKPLFPVFVDPETGQPNPAVPTYDDRVVWIFDPAEENGSFRDRTYTLAWRVVHEVAHGLTNEAMTEKYGGRGRRAGALGVVVRGPFHKQDTFLSLPDAMRAIEWEAVTFQEQARIFREDFGIEISDEQFLRENSVNLADAVYRALSGQFGNPGEIGVVPTAIDAGQLLGNALDVVRQAAREQQIDTNEVFTPNTARSFDQPARGGRRAGIEFDPLTGDAVIRLNASSDLTSFLHESGHLFLESFHRLVSSSSAVPADMVQDWETIREWFAGRSDQLVQWMRDNRATLIDRHGAADVDSAISAGPEAMAAQALAGDIGSATGAAAVRARAMHEMWAESFESYLQTANAPSKRLKTAFRRFRNWITSVYRAMRPTVDDEIREVMDRMLSTDRQMAEVDNDLGFTATRGLDMTDAQRDRYAEALEEARVASREKADAERLEVVRRRQTKDWERRLRVREKEARAQLEQEPLYQADHWLRNGVFLGEPPANATGAQPGKLAARVLEDQYGEEVLRRLAGGRRGVWARNGTLTPDQVAEFFSRPGNEISSEDLVEGLQGLTPIDERAQEIASAAMEREFGTPQAELAAILDSAAHEQEARERALSLEHQAIRQMAEADLLRGEARRQVAAEGPGTAAERRADVERAQQALREAQGAEDEEAVQAALVEVERARARLSEAQSARVDSGIARGMARSIEAEETALGRQVAAEEREARAARREGGRASERSVRQFHDSLRALARQQVEGITVGRLRPDLFRAAEQRAMRAERRAVSARDWDAAEQAMRDRVYNYHAYGLALELKQQNEKNRRRLQTFQRKPATRKRLAKARGGHLEQIDRLLERFDLRSSVSLREVEQDERQRRSAVSLREYELQLAQSAEYIQVPDHHFEFPGIQSYKALTSAEFQDLRDTVDSIAHQASRDLKRLEEQSEANLQEARQELALGLDETGNLGRRAGQGQLEVGVIGDLKHPLQELHASHTKMEYLWRWLDSKQALGPLWRRWYQPVNEAADREADLGAEMGGQLRDLYTSHYSRAERAQWDLPFGVTSVKYDAFPQKLSKPQVLAMALNWGNDGNRSALMTSFSMSYQQVEALFDEAMTDNDWSFVQGVWDLLEQLRPEAFAVHREMTGVTPSRVEPTAVRTKSGRVLRGGYYPIQYDPDSSRFIDAVRQREAAQGLMGGLWASKTTNWGHLKDRREGGATGKQLVLDLSVAEGHILNVVHDITHRRAVVELWRMLNDPVIAEMLRSSLGAAMHRRIGDWVQAIATGDQAPYMEGAWLIRRLQSGVTVMAMGLRLTTPLLQPLGYTKSVKHLGERYALVGLRRFLGKDWMSGHIDESTGEQVASQRQFVLDRSSFMRTRMQNFDRDIRQAQRQIGAGAVLPEPTHASLWMIGMAQSLVDLPTWLGAYAKAMDGAVDEIEMGNETAAISFADQTVRLSQSSGAIKDLASIQRGGPYKRLWTMFYSFFSSQYNDMADELGMTHRMRNLMKPRAIANLFWIAVLPPILEEMLRAIGGDDDFGDEDDGPFDPWFWFKRIVSFNGGSVVGVRDVAGAWDRGWGYDITPIAQVGQAAVTTIEKTQEGDFDRTFWKNAAYTLGATTAVLGFPLPTPAMFQHTETFVRWLSGDFHAGDLVRPRRPE